MSVNTETIPQREAVWSRESSGTESNVNMLAKHGITRLIPEGRAGMSNRLRPQGEWCERGTRKYAAARHQPVEVVVLILFSELQAVNC